MNLQQRVYQQVSKLSHLDAREKAPALQELQRKTQALKSETQAVDRTVDAIAEWQKQNDRSLAGIETSAPMAPARSAGQVLSVPPA